MGDIESFCKAEKQIEVIGIIDAKEDLEYIKVGRADMVDLFESNRFMMDVVNRIYGFKERV